MKWSDTEMTVLAAQYLKLQQRRWLVSSYGHDKVRMYMTKENKNIKAKYKEVMDANKTNVHAVGQSHLVHIHL